MKKILSIALALVMVLSMSSAFAIYCDWGAWECDTTTIRCGKATIEVVEYVRSTTACADGFSFVANDCAVAIPNENVYYAVKLTVPSDISEDWYKAANLKIKFSDITMNTNIPSDNDITGSLPAWNDVKKGGTWYLRHNTTTDATAWDASAIAWEKQNDDFTFGNKNVFSAKAAKTSAKVTATLKSVWAIGTATDANWSWNGEDGKDRAPDVKIGDYTFSFHKYDSDIKYITVQKGTNKVAHIELDGDNKVDLILVSDDNDATQYQVVGRNGSDFAGIVVRPDTGETAGYKVNLSTTCNEGAWLQEVLNFLKIDLGTCMTDQGISNNFGWNDTIKSSTDYSSTGTAIVDVNCEISIPKTGDASVIAYAVMALVTAAGALKIKK